jgi:predicted transcriptional regulator
MDTTLAKKRAVGRPMKPPRRGKRASLSLLVRPDIKRLVDKLATANGITQSAQGEMLIEHGITVRQVLDAMGKELEEIERGNFDAAAKRRGYNRHRILVGDKAWSLWTEPGFPIPTGGFKPWREGELEATYPDYETAPASGVIEPPPLPPDLAESNPDRLYLVWVRGVGWKWEAAPPQAGAVNPQSRSPEGENK